MGLGGMGLDLLPAFACATNLVSKCWRWSACDDQSFEGKVCDFTTLKRDIEGERVDGDRAAKSAQHNLGWDERC